MKQTEGRQVASQNTVPLSGPTIVGTPCVPPAVSLRPQKGPREHAGHILFHVTCSAPVKPLSFKNK